MVRSRISVLSCCLLTAACGKDDGEAEGDLSKALSHVVEGQDKAKARADSKAMDKLEARAAEKAAAARKEQMEKLLVVPEDAPVELDEACKQVAEGFDAYKTARLEGEAEIGRWNAIKSRDLAKMEKACKDAGDLEVAACKIHAMRNAPPTFVASDATKILLACEDRYGEGSKRDEDAEAEGKEP